MSRIHDLLADMEAGLIGLFRPITKTLAAQEHAGVSCKKVALSVPFGQDFATWHTQQRRRLLDEDAAPVYH